MDKILRCLRYVEEIRFLHDQTLEGGSETKRCTFQQDSGQMSQLYTADLAGRCPSCILQVSGQVSQLYTAGLADRCPSYILQA